MIEVLLQAERALEMGRVDAAETLYRQVADNDPRNAIAVVGLARVALERGDEVGALALARRALEIDPENAAAGRMVTRLEEIATYRGDAIAPAAAPTPETVPAEPDAASATVPGSEVVPVPVPGSGSGSEVDPGSVPVPGSEPVPEVLPSSVPDSVQPGRRRSWLDRLLGRNR